MLIGSAIYSILSTDTAVAALVGTRIFPNLAPEAVKTFPLLVYKGESAELDKTMAGTSNFGKQQVTIAILSQSYAAMATLGVKVVSAMVGSKGIIGGVKIENV